MAYNKFITTDGLVLLDLTADTVTANKLPKGITAHDRSGTPIIGTVEVNSAIPIEVSTEAEMTVLLESGEVGGVYKYTGTTGTYENGALYVLEAEMYTISVTTDGAVRGVDSITHIKFNSPPTSADDYDRTSEDGSATVTASKAYIWGGGYILNDGGEMYTYDYDYSTAKEVIFTQDSSLSIATLYASSGGSND